MKTYINIDQKIKNLEEENLKLSSGLHRELINQRFNSDFLAFSKKLFSNSEIIKILKNQKTMNDFVFDFSNGSFFLHILKKKTSSQIFYAITKENVELWHHTDLDVEVVKVEKGEIIGFSNTDNIPNLSDKFEDVYVDVLPSILKASFTKVGRLLVWGEDEGEFWKTDIICYYSDYDTVLSCFNHYDDHDFDDFVPMEALA